MTQTTPHGTTNTILTVGTSSMTRFAASHRWSHRICRRSERSLNSITHDNFSIGLRFLRGLGEHNRIECCITFIWRSASGHLFVCQPNTLNRADGRAKRKAYGLRKAGQTEDFMRTGGRRMGKERKEGKQQNGRWTEKIEKVHNEYIMCGLWVATNNARYCMMGQYEQNAPRSRTMLAQERQVGPT